MMTKQLPLALSLREDFTFDNFLCFDHSHLFTQLIKDLNEKTERFYYLWGLPAVGKTHLLQACCNYLGRQGSRVTYIALKEHQVLSPQIFENLELLDLIAIDDIDAIADKSEWENALFHLINRVALTQTLLIITGNSSPSQLKLKLPDLTSRLAGSLIFQMHELNDEQKAEVLRHRAKLRGFDLPVRVVEYLLSHCSRNMVDLFHILDRLDQASLAHQRILTVPFVKTIIEGSDGLN